jgi:RNA polymerase sigma factor (sigma-70 family)
MGIDQRASTTRPATSDVGDLYHAFSGRLERIVRGRVRASDALIEDACQFAWSRLAHHAGRVRSDAVLSWLAKTAVHEALKLIRREGRELSLEMAVQETPGMLLSAVVPGPEELFEHRERLDAIRALPTRQQRLLWLQGIGLSYSDIAASTGDSNRTVERQLLRAKRALRATASETAALPKAA